MLSTDDGGAAPDRGISTAPRPAVSTPIPKDVLTRAATANPVAATTPATLTRYQRVMDTFDEAKFRDLAARFVAAGTWQVPTLIRLRTMQIGDDARYRNDPNLRYVPKRVKQMWEDVSLQFRRRDFPGTDARRCRNCSPCKPGWLNHSKTPAHK